MNKYILLSLFLLPFNFAMAQSKLEIKITGLKNDMGNVSVELLDKNKCSIRGAKGKIENKECSFVFENLKNDKYAIRFFHDENENGEIDKNLIGIPKEGFGLSNKGMGNFGPKKFEKWLFSVSGNTRVHLKTKYY